MGHKADPRVMRLKITDTWKSRWFARGKDFSTRLKQDEEIRKYILKKFEKAGILRIDIERLNQEVKVIIHSTRPGMIIGKGGSGVEEIKNHLRKKVKKGVNINISIEEAKRINIQAKVWADTIAEQLEKRMSHRRAMKTALEQIMDGGAEGVKIAVAGRIGGADIARSEWLYKGKLPLHTLRANIDFARSTAFTTYGTVGVKVWINKGEIFESEKESEDISSPSSP